MVSLHSAITDALLAYYLSGTPAALRVVRSNLPKVAPTSRKSLNLILQASNPKAVLKEIDNTFAREFAHETAQ